MSDVMRDKVFHLKLISKCLEKQKKLILFVRYTLFLWHCIHKYKIYCLSCFFFFQKKKRMLCRTKGYTANSPTFEIMSPGNHAHNSLTHTHKVSSATFRATWWSIVVFGHIRHRFPSRVFLLRYNNVKNIGKIREGTFGTRSYIFDSVCVHLCIQPHLQYVSSETLFTEPWYSSYQTNDRFQLLIFVLSEGGTDSFR